MLVLDDVTVFYSVLESILGSGKSAIKDDYYVCTIDFCKLTVYFKILS